MRQVLTERIFESSFDCTYKCHLLRNGRRENKTEYEEHTEHFDGMYQRAAISRLQEMNPVSNTLYLDSLSPSVLQNTAQLVVLKHVEANGLLSDSIVLARSNSTHAPFQPLLFHRYEEVNSRAKLLLAFRAIIIETVTGTTLSHGRIVFGHDFTSATIPLPTFTTKVKLLIRSIDELALQEPSLFLCSHCEICEFRAGCQARAIKDDNMSLLHGIGRAHIEEQNRKGIFTLHQYSHTFRPRRLPKRVKNPSKPRYFSLQARAIRDNKIYIHGNPTFPIVIPAIYFDIEGIPGRRFQYLFGMLAVTETGESFQSFWANDKSEQSTILIKFCEAASSYSNATMFHYGNYEMKAIKEMASSLNQEHVSLVDHILKSCKNVLPVLHHHCYFPTHSNRLKDVAGFLGYKFDNKICSGVMSIVFRDVLKDELINYNRQDCEALKTVCEFVAKSTALASTRGTIPGRDEEVQFAGSLRKAGEGNRPIFKKAEFSCPEFELVNKCAYFDYQRDRVFARTQRLQRKLNYRAVRKTERRISLSTKVVATVPNSCPVCGSRKMVFERKSVRWQIDLKYYKTGIGVKKWQPRYLVSSHRCVKCNNVIKSPSIPLGGRTKYGYGLMCWCVYHNIVGKQSMLSVFRGLNDIFALNVGTQNTYRFKSTLASYYKDLSKEILSTVLKAKVVHIDETPVKLRNTIGYVWVISSGTEVCYFYKDSREGSFLQDLLGSFRGILVSDFFTAYDSIGCGQQKCLLHLMRDINDDLRRNPYDEEMRSVAEPFAKLLKEIVLTIDRYGLRRRHLRKHIKPAERLCASIAHRNFTSLNATKYQSRFDKYGGRLFTFLNYDGVPWNNNNAEHAVHHFAKLRRIGDGTYTRSSLDELLVLLTVLETCEYRNVNALKFLLSGKRQLSEMTASSIEVG